MSSVRIGQILSRLVPLSDHDVEEIIHEQKSTRLRFGDAALALGLVRPSDVWSAWSEQLDSSGGEIDLSANGIDVQAISRIDAATAQRFQVVPVRVSPTALVVASTESLGEEDRRTIEQVAGVHTVFVRASAADIEQALSTYYASASSRTAA
jgi:hypothetical protein